MGCYLLLNKYGGSSRTRRVECFTISMDPHKNQKTAYVDNGHLKNSMLSKWVFLLLEIIDIQAAAPNDQLQLDAGLYNARNDYCFYSIIPLTNCN